MSKRDWLVRVFAGFCVFDCSMDFMSYFRSLTLENPQNKRSAVSLVNPSHDTSALGIFARLDSRYESSQDLRESLVHLR